MNRALKLAGSAVCIGAAFIVWGTFSFQIPFVEGDRVVTEGSGYGFSIGMTRAECMSIVRSKYAEPDVHLRALWPKASEHDAELAKFENTNWALNRNRNLGEHRVLVAEVSELGPPFDRTNLWQVKLPASWVNDINLEFEGDRLVRIQRSRWLFER